MGSGLLKLLLFVVVFVVCRPPNYVIFFAAEKLPERPSGSQSIHKWFSTVDVKTVSKLVKPEATKTSEGKSTGIWGDFDSDSVPDAVLLMAADAAEHQEIKTERRQTTDGELHFPGQGQKLGEASNTSSVSLGSIRRHIPGIGFITGRSVIGESKPLDGPFTKTSPNAAAADVSKRLSLSHPDSKPLNRQFTKPLPNTAETDISRRQSLARLSSPGLSPLAGTAGDQTTPSSAAPVKFESVAEFRKTIGMVMSPAGTEVRVKNFVSVCNPNSRLLQKPNNPLAAPRLRSECSVSNDDVTRPVKKMRFSPEATSSTSTTNGHSSSAASTATHPNNLVLQLDRSVSIRGDDNIIVVNSDSETDVKNDRQTVREDLNANQSEGRSTASDILCIEASVDEAGPAGTDQAVGGIDTGDVFRQPSYVTCPVCQISVPADVINEHLDQCLM